MSAIIKITEPSGRVWELGLDAGRTYTIGRAKENDIVLNDRRVSRKHAHITSENDEYTLIDGYYENGNLVRSVNHVMVNGVPQIERPLGQNDTITIGETEIEFRKITPYNKQAMDEHFSRQPTNLASVNISIPGYNEPQVVEPPAAEAPAPVKYDDAPLGHTQLQISANEIIGRGSHASMESPIATPEEIKDLRRKAKMLELLYEMSRTLGTVFDLTEIFAKATDLIFRGTPADRVVALLTDENAADHELHQIALKTRDESVGKMSEKLTVSRTITQKVMRERVGLLSQDARTDAQFYGAESIVSQGVRSTICAPLITESSVHGVVYADRLDPFAAFTEDHLELITAVAAQAAVTVETVRAHTRLAREEVARANYSRFMPEYVVKQLLDDPDSFRLGGANQTQVTIFKSLGLACEDVAAAQLTHARLKESAQKHYDRYPDPHGRYRHHHPSQQPDLFKQPHFDVRDSLNKRIDDLRAEMNRRFDNQQGLLETIMGKA